eukprot:GFKZ01000441.1.p1 GENE.GFKZ01000441.1~~GFKZ01000441.1.p1  ORF type:complete len:781 (+),score=110.16 GFKZ01000441.1:1058-3400(+)
MKARNTLPTPPYTCDRDILPSEAKPWTEPLDIRLLSMLPSDQHMDNLSSSANRDGCRDFEELPVHQTAESTSNHDYDFDAQFQHTRSDYDSENADETNSSSAFQCSKELLELIQTRVKKFERLAKKHRDRERKRIAQTGNSPRDTTAGADASGTQDLRSLRESSNHTNRSKSFVQGLSCGISSFLSRPSKNNTESEDVPVRLNRLHGADKSSMSILSPTLRTEFLRMSYTKGKMRRNLHRARQQPQSCSAPDWNTFVEHDPNHLSCCDPSPHQTTSTVPGMDLQNVENQGQERANEWGAVEWGEEDFRDKLVEHNSKHLSRRDLSTDQTKIAGSDMDRNGAKQVQGEASECGATECEVEKFRYQLATSRKSQGTELPRGVREDEGSSQEAIEDTMSTSLAPIPRRLSDADSDIVWSTVREAQKWELPVSISDLIEQYDAADPSQQEVKSQSEKRLRESSQMELPFDIERVRSLFERPGDGKGEEVQSRCRTELTMSTVDSRTSLYRKTDGLLGNEKTGKKRFGMRMEPMALNKVSSASNDVHRVAGTEDRDLGDTVVAMEIGSPTEMEDARLSSKDEKGEQSFMSSITSTESPSPTPSSQKAISPRFERLDIMCSSEKEFYGWNLEERDREVHDNSDDQQKKPDVAPEGGEVSCTGERMNLGDLFDSIELSSNAERKGQRDTSEKRREKVRFRSNHDARQATKDGDKAGRSERRKRAMSFVARRETGGRGSDAHGKGDRRRTEGLGTREESKMLGLLREHRQRVKRKMVIIRNIVSADDY